MVAKSSLPTNGSPEVELLPMVCRAPYQPPCMHSWSHSVRPCSHSLSTRGGILPSLALQTQEDMDEVWAMYSERQAHGGAGFAGRGGVHSAEAAAAAADYGDMGYPDGYAEADYGTHDGGEYDDGGAAEYSGGQYGDGSDVDPGHGAGSGSHEAGYGAYGGQGYADVVHQGSYTGYVLQQAGDGPEWGVGSGSSSDHQQAPQQQQHEAHRHY